MYHLDVADEIETERESWRWRERESVRETLIRRNQII